MLRQVYLIGENCVKKGIRALTHLHASERKLMSNFWRSVLRDVLQFLIMTLGSALIQFYLRDKPDMAPA